MENVMARREVYELIDRERNYQNNLGPEKTDGRKKTVGDYITMLHGYVNRATEAWLRHPGDIHSLGEIRKIGAIAVKCMEEYGAPERG